MDMIVAVSLACAYCTFYDSSSEHRRPYFSDQVLEGRTGLHEPSVARLLHVFRSDSANDTRLALHLHGRDDGFLLALRSLQKFGRRSLAVKVNV